VRKAAGLAVASHQYRVFQSRWRPLWGRTQDNSCTDCSPGFWIEIEESKYW